MKLKKCTLYDSLRIEPLEDNEQETAWQKHASQILKKIISTRLTHRQKQVIVLYFYKGMKQREIALKLGITESAVSHTKKTALERIRKYLEIIRR